MLYTEILTVTQEIDTLKFSIACSVGVSFALKSLSAADKYSESIGWLGPDRTVL
jgi:hypothetical protein